MTEIILTVCGLLFGLMIAIAGAYYLRRAKDEESRRIYLGTIAVGAVIAAAMAIKIALTGF